MSFNLDSYHTDLAAMVKQRVTMTSGENEVKVFKFAQSYFDKMDGQKADVVLEPGDIQIPGFIFEMEDFEESSINPDETINFVARCCAWVIVGFNTPNHKIIARILALKTAGVIRAWDGTTQNFQVVPGDLDDSEFHSTAEPGYEQFYIMKVTFTKQLCVGVSAWQPSCHPLDPLSALPSQVFASAESDTGLAHEDDYHDLTPIAPEE